MPRNLETIFVVKFGSKSVGTPDGEPRKELLEHNAKELAQVRESGLVVMLSSGAELFGRKKVLTPRHKDYLRERKDQIRSEYGDDEEALALRIKEFNETVTRDIHREGQEMLMEVWRHAFDQQGVHVIAELLDGKKRDLSEDIRVVDDRDKIIIFNGHGSLDPDGKSRDNDLNLPPVVESVARHVNEDPDDPRTRLFVLGVTDPATRGLLTRGGNQIRVYRGTSIHRHPDITISRGGPESKALAFLTIKETHPRSRVGISGNRGKGTITDFRFGGRADTIIELREKRNSNTPRTKAS